MARVAAPRTVAQLSAREARRIALHAQGLSGPRIAGGPPGMLTRLRAVQLDTISVLARSHELVAHARLDGTTRARIENGYWGPGSSTFEYWSHAACVLPLEDWPLYEAKRRAVAKKGRRWHALDGASTQMDAVRDRLRVDGPLTARQLGGAKSGGEWFEWSDVKIAVEWLLDIGEVACRQRRGFERVYDLSERAVPAALRDVCLDDDECATALVVSAARALGVATPADLAAYHGQRVTAVRKVLEAAALEVVSVEGWRELAYVAPGALGSATVAPRRTAVLLSPFDPLLWDRARTERLFSVRYRLEAYVPARDRVHGYFAMPVLAGDRLVALVDPSRDAGTLRARHVVALTEDAPRHVAAALARAARWVGCERVCVDRATPPHRHADLVAAVEAVA